jgi:hypothetical protein
MTFKFADFILPQIIQIDFSKGKSGNLNLANFTTSSKNIVSSKFEASLNNDKMNPVDGALILNAVLLLSYIEIKTFILI